MLRRRSLHRTLQASPSARLQSREGGIPKNLQKRVVVVAVQSRTHLLEFPNLSTVEPHDSPPNRRAFINEEFTATRREGGDLGLADGPEDAATDAQEGVPFPSALHSPEGNSREQRGTEQSRG